MERDHSSANSRRPELDTCLLQPFGRSQGPQEQDDIMHLSQAIMLSPIYPMSQYQLGQGLFTTPGQGLITTPQQTATNYFSRLPSTVFQHSMSTRQHGLIPLLTIDRDICIDIMQGFKKRITQLSSDILASNRSHETIHTQQSEIAAQVAARTPPQQPSPCNVSATCKEGPSSQTSGENLPSVYTKASEPKTIHTQQSEIAAQVAARTPPQQPSPCNVSATCKEGPSSQTSGENLPSIYTKASEPKTLLTQQSEIAAQVAARTPPQQPSTCNVSATCKEGPSSQTSRENLPSVYTKASEPKEEEEQQMKEEIEHEEIKPTWTVLENIWSKIHEYVSKRKRTKNEQPRMDQYSSWNHKIVSESKMLSRVRSMNSDRTDIDQRPAEERSVGHERKDTKTPEKPSTLVLEPTDDQMGSVSERSNRVKKILINKDIVIGHGCHGTTVYRGKFDERDVAVKQLLRVYFNLADREVKLLREADQHPNVIRYYAMEEDKDFLYIALELCEGTLQDYVEGKLQNTKNIKTIELIRQILNALAHLHSLGIVHRDLKPHNILISKPGAQGEVRAMISDFGLSMKLPPGQESFSSKSEFLGTVGWAAPEMSKSDQKRTLKLDIFSAGCLMYYVFTKGLHPFGNGTNERPYNIEKGTFNLDGLPMTSDREIAKDIIQKMLSNEPGTRPSAKEVLHHPLFWDKEKTLIFIQDASDCIEANKVHNLEQDGAKIVRVDWTKHLSQELQTDIQRIHKKFKRRYDGSAVKDLLRVIRNKRHHYNELPADVKKSLGSLPEEFLDYFTTRFPLLLIHTYHVMECCANLDTFKHYYKCE